MSSYFIIPSVEMSRPATEISESNHFTAVLLQTGIQSLANNQALPTYTQINEK
jgi:hypothetical protein